MTEFFQTDISEVDVQPSPALSRVDSNWSTAVIYAMYAERITGSGIARAIFNAMPRVVDKDKPASTFLKWPPRYGTSAKPWGIPPNPETGERGLKLEGEDWTSAVDGTAKQRLAALRQDADLSLAIVSGIDQALAEVLQYGTVVVDIGATSVTVDVPWVVNERSAPTAVWLYGSASGNYPAVKYVQLSSNSFTIAFASAVTGAACTLRWSATVGR
jgi:hypothetical protein